MTQEKQVAASIISEDVKEKLAVANAVESTYPEIAQNLYRGIVEQADRNSLLPLFYGKRAYELIDSIEDAINGLFVLKCAMDVYTLIQYKGKMGQLDAWAQNKMSNDDNFRSFFAWVGSAKGKISPDDHKPLKALKNAMQEQNRSFCVSATVQNLTLVEIIQGLSDGNIKLQGGELK